MISCSVALAATNALVSGFAVLHDAWSSVTNKHPRFLPEKKYPIADAVAATIETLEIWNAEIGDAKSVSLEATLQGINSSLTTSANTVFMPTESIQVIIRDLKSLDVNNVGELKESTIVGLDSLCGQMNAIVEAYSLQV